jgi:hypothetical protein
MTIDLQKAEEIARDVSDKSDADVFLYNGSINEQNYGALLQCLPTNRKKTAILVLVTNGGLPNVAYRIAKLFHALYEKFIVYVPGPCKSAGTLIAIGAHELLMSMFSELGPLDVQLPKRDELGEKRSGLTGRVALASLAEQAYQTYETMLLELTGRSGRQIRFKTASQLASTMTTQLFAPIYAQIDPVNVGEDSRDLDVAKAYGERLVLLSKNCTKVTINKLIHKYPSHDFVIDTDEARTLFVNVNPPSKELIDLPSAIPDIIFSALGGNGMVLWLSKPLPPPPPPPPPTPTPNVPVVVDGSPEIADNGNSNTEEPNGTQSDGNEPEPV